MDSNPFAPTTYSLCFKHMQTLARPAFPSIPSNNEDFGRKFETETRFFCHFFAKRHVRFDPVVGVVHALSSMAVPTENIISVD
jgi:hypothetical protein